MPEPPQTDGAGGPAAPFLPPADICQQIWAEDAYGRVVLHADGTIKWANEAAAAMVGHRAEDVIGRNMAEFIAPDEVALALEAVAEIGDERSIADEGVPLVLGLRRPDGTAFHVEIGASNFLAVPGMAGIALRLRPYDSQRHLERFLTALVAGVPMDEDLMLLVESLDHLVQESASAIVYGADGNVFGRVVTACLGRAVTAALTGEVDDPDALPWARCLRTGELETCLVTHLPEDVRKVAEEHGFLACWAQPIVVPQEGPVAVIVVWRRLDGSPRIGHRHALNRSAQASALAFERRRSEELLVRAATVDALTGMPNRSQFFATLEESMDTAQPGRVGVLYLDLDGFKPVNDTHGHRIGDRLLAEVGAVLIANIRPGDMVARLGGDEFAVLCLDVAGEDELSAVADRLIQMVKRPFALDGIEILIGVSIGVAVAKIHGHTHDEVLDAADAALYRAKREGRGCYRIAQAS